MQPNNMEEFSELFYQNVRVSGYGYDMTIHSPCPFCAAPEFMVYKVAETRQVSSQSHKCNECERLAKMLFIDDEKGGTMIEMVQTGGPEQPSWSMSKMRREQ